jgi:thiol-disulfide isomerase/thioredoxin
MDRLHPLKLGAAAVLVVALGPLGCEKSGEKKQPPDTGGRVDAVEVTRPEKQVSLEEFCDVRAASKDAAPALAMPPLAGGQTTPGKGTWRWVNLWATWCKPCIEEMPQLVAWQKELGDKGPRFDLVFVSVDDNDEVVARFREKHPDAPPSLRLADADALPKWLAAIGLGESAPIPVHVFVDPDDKVRCVRAGGVKEKDLAAVKRILGSP